MLFGTITAEEHGKCSLKHAAPVASEENMQRMHSFWSCASIFFITSFGKWC